MTNLQNTSIATKEGWLSFVQAAPRTPPKRMTPRQLTKLSAAERKHYDVQRRDWHANMGVLRTPQFQELQDGLWNILDSNVQDGHRVKGAIAVEGSAGLGKSTAVEQFAKDYHLRDIAENGAMTDAGHERWPVCRVTLSGHPTMRDLNLSLLHFFAHPGVSRGNAADFARRALNTFLACETRLLIVDDVHFLHLRAADGVKVSNHLKFIANEFPVTIVLVGIGLTEAGLFSEGGSKKESIVAQTGRRTTKFTVERFEVRSAIGRFKAPGRTTTSQRKLSRTRVERGFAFGGNGRAKSTDSLAIGSIGDETGYRPTLLVNRQGSRRPCGQRLLSSWVVTARRLPNFAVTLQSSAKCGGSTATDPQQRHSANSAKRGLNSGSPVNATRRTSRVVAAHWTARPSWRRSQRSP